jgi:hypothetical protein
MKKGAAELFHQQALAYYYQNDSIRPDPRSDNALVWYWQEGLGLTFKKVPRPILCDVYAMRMARLALQHDPKHYPAVSLWLAAYIKREMNLPAGATDPIQGAEQLPSRFYALASGAKYLQDVLGRALKDKHSAMAAKVIELLVQTSGARSLAQPVTGGAQPLVDALGYPDRNVRFLAAEALARALPDRKFAGEALVVPALIDALRQTGAKTAVLIAGDDKQRKLLADLVRAAGVEVKDHPDLASALTVARESAGVDVFVLGLVPDPAEVAATIRRDVSFSGVPILVGGSSERLRAMMEKDGRIVATDADPKPEALKAAVDEAIQRGAGTPLTSEQAAAWAIRSAEALRMLGLTGNAVLDPAPARSSLVACLAHSDANVQTAAARALAVQRASEAQQAIAGLALKADAPEPVRVAAFDAATESSRRFGAQVTEEQVRGLVDVVTGKGSEPIRTAAAKLLGALSLPSEKIKDLIHSTAGND